MRCWRRCEPPSATPAWKSQFKATEEPRSISPTGFQLFWEQKIKSNWSDTQKKGNGDQPNRFQTLLRPKIKSTLSNKEEWWGSSQQVYNSFENKHVNYRNIPLFQKIISINDFLLKARHVQKRWLSLGEHGSLLDCRQRSVRFPENPVFNSI